MIFPTTYQELPSTISYYSDLEIANLLSLYETSPLIKRVVDILQKYGSAVKFLNEKGIDLEQVPELVDDYDSTIQNLHGEVCALEERLQRLEGQTVLDQIDNLRSEVQSIVAEARDLKYQNQQLSKSLAEYKSKLSMWAALNGNN